MIKYLRAGYPLLAVETADERAFVTRAYEELSSFANERGTTIQVFWHRQTGLEQITGPPGRSEPARATLQEAVQQARAASRTVVFLSDLQRILQNPGVYRVLLDAIPSLRRNQSMLVLLAPHFDLPQELLHEVAVLVDPLPTREQLRRPLDVVVRGSNAAVEDEAALLDAAAGLTTLEAENAFALSVIERGKLDPEVVWREKMRLVRQTGYLEVWQPVSPDRVGGLDLLKHYIAEEVVPSKDDPDLRVRGILLVGVPGTGKSLSAKAAAALLGWPVLRMDIGALKGSLVGQSEANIRAALRLADAVAPAVLWIDEIEKGVGGYRSSAVTDGGTTLSMVGTLLTWMQEHESPVIVIATCNDYSKLPTELTRPGRFDERFFVDLPTSSERVEIARIHIRRFQEDDGAAEVAAELEGYTGAEIEAAVKSAARRTGRRITAEALREAARAIRPIAETAAEEIQALRTWARRALRPASSSQEDPLIRTML